ncbi:SRPBCC domain-containing protein [uncultured Pseudokineococcus sp.]|uniref:SRPBCC family protein n=1 Tax=uncultured Pseudokineococcus sp. TaxID=1642928 RepID=UPI00260858EB|nr:SRPBCC domain-containing protein [uncultured Pseudokineococcus sp.]
MGIRVIETTVEVAAPPERVWDVLLDDATYRQWTAAFAEDCWAETDWSEGSEVRFLGPGRSGLRGRVVTSRRPELVDVEFDGLVVDGRDDVDSEGAREYRGAHETYRLSPVPGGTRLEISAAMEEEHHDAMTAAWDDALARVQELSTVSDR